MAKRRPVNNPLALAVLTFLTRKPMYPYEMASVLRSTGKDLTIKINWGSLYTVMQNLEKHGFIEEASTTRQGGRPERTAYAITDSGRAEMRDWLSELLGEPRQEYPLFAAALSLVGALPPDEAIESLRRRLAALDAEIAAHRADLRTWRRQVPRLFLIESEYLVAMRGAEARWLRALLKDIADGSMPEIEQWREYHETGRFPDDLVALLEEGSPPTEHLD
ncbi:helix-turn-helix transcriptional regulator [Actinomadura scrupuli]|uniref:helix-turn-helix transcriptional regulator n=1 Tax=Actinomadura scrupuli TaxID=559629 RepID=UPI003D96EB52